MSFTGNAAQAETRIRRVAPALPPEERDRLPGAVGRDPPAAGARATRDGGRRPLDAAADASGGRFGAPQEPSLTSRSISTGAAVRKRHDADPAARLLPGRARSGQRVRLAAAADREQTTARARAWPSLSSRTTPTATSSTFQTASPLHVPVARVKRRRRQRPRRTAATRSPSTRRCSSGEAPDLNHIWTFVAPQSTRWPACSTRSYAHHSPSTSTSSPTAGATARLPCSRPRPAAANNSELQLMAVAGMSFYAASGDDGLVRLRSRSASPASRSTIRPCSRTPPASAAPTSTRASPRRSGAATARRQGGGGGGVSLSSPSRRGR